MTAERPCPSHPEDGPVPWFEVIQGARFPGDPSGGQRGELPVCLPCVRDSKPTGRQEFAS